MYRIFRGAWGNDGVRLIHQDPSTGLLKLRLETPSDLWRVARLVRPGERVGIVGFVHDRMNRFEIHCAPDNLRSAGVPRRLGYTHEATLRKRFDTGQGTLRDTTGSVVPAIVGRYALGRPAAPEEIAAGILFLTAHESSFVTGITLAVDGGRTFH